MNNGRYDILEAYRNKILSEDGGGMANPPTSSAANAPAGAMSSGPYLDQFHENPKLAVYNHPTRKKKVFTREEDLEEFLKENPDWSKEPFEESRELEEARSWEKTIHINKIEDRTREHLKLNDMFRIGKAALKADGSEIRGSVVLGADVEETFIKIAFDGGNSIDISHYDLKDGKIYTISFPKDAAKALKKIL